MQSSLMSMSLWKDKVRWGQWERRHYRLEMQRTEWESQTGLLESQSDTGRMRDFRKDDRALEEEVEVAGIVEKNMAAMFAEAVRTNSLYSAVVGQLGTRIQRGLSTDTLLDCTAGGRRSHQRCMHCCWSCYMLWDCSLAAVATEWVGGHIAGDYRPTVSERRQTSIGRNS